MRKSKYLKAILCLGVIIIIIVVLNNVFLADTVDNSQRLTWLQEIKSEEVNTLDVVFIGDSTCTNAFKPIQLWEEKGITSNNIGFAYGAPSEMYHIVKRLFSYQSPRCIVLEGSMFYETKAEGNFLKSDIFEISDLDSDLFEYLNDFCPIVKHKSILKGKSASFLLKHKPKRLHSYDKGYNYVSDVSSAAKGENDIDYELISNSDKYLERIINICTDNDCMVLMVNAPQISKWNSSIGDTMLEFANGHSIKMIDYNSDLFSDACKIDWTTDTNDGGTHLNYSGATKTTKAIGDYLVNELGLKPTKLTKEQADKWNADAKEFHKTIGE